MSTTATKERPIVMSGDEVRAILAGATQFRRVVRPQPPQPYPNGIGPTWAYWPERDAFVPSGTLVDFTADQRGGIKCPFGRVGSRLWAKHPARISGRSANGFLVTDEGFRHADGNDYRFFHWHLFPHNVPAEGKRFGVAWPRMLSLLTLEITDIKVERNNAGLWDWVVTFRRLGTEVRNAH